MVRVVRGSVYLEPGYALWIPPGFAHGFQALEDTYLLYPVTKEYSPQHERCVKWDDPEIMIPWPLKDNIIVSERDKRYLPPRDAEINFEYVTPTPRGETFNYKKIWGYEKDI